MKRFRFFLFQCVLGLMLLSLTWLYQTLSVAPPQEIKAAPKIYHQNLREIVLNAVEKAEESLDISIYALTDRKTLNLLNQKAQEGVEVRIWYDAQASPELPTQLNKAIKLFPLKLQGLMHQKLLVIDGQEVWLGSANLTRGSLSLHKNLIMHVTSRAMADWVVSQLLVPGSHLPPGAFSFIDQQLTLYWLPAHRHVDLKVLKALRTAQKTVRIAMFTWTRHDFADAVIDAHQRGLKVEVVMDKESAKGTSHRIALKLKKAKIPLFVNKNSCLMHHKFVWIDSSTLCHGSANCTQAAYTRNAEDLCILEPLTPAQNDSLEELWACLLQACLPAG